MNNREGETSALKPPKRSGLPRPASGLNTPIRGSRESLTGAVDDWIIGDRCFIAGGSKSGRVAFLGETRFAQGEWAGVVLDDAAGKNDGSVGGVKYFQCPPNRGIFCRVNKLVRNAEGSSSLLVESNMPPPKLPDKGGEIESDEQFQDASAEMDESMLNVSSTTNNNRDGGEAKVGDRVLVGGGKNGVLRFVGETEFAQGVWGGVELDQPIGKNDGAVQGKRYFVCKPRYGLFAPLAKIELVPVPKTMSSSKRLPVRQTLTSNMRLQRMSASRTGSQESLSSLSSVQSSASKRVRQPVSSSNDAHQIMQKINASRSGSTGPNNATTTSSSIVSPTLNAFQMILIEDSLKEKEQHVDQLLRERDIERSEMAKLSQQLEESRQEVVEIKEECKRTLNEIQMQKDHFHSLLQQSEQECKRFKETFEEEKKRNEDLQFRIEEESILKADLESRLSELEKSLTPSSTTSETEQLRISLDASLSKVRDLEKHAAEHRKSETSLRESLLKKETEVDSISREKDQQIQMANDHISKLKEDVEYLRNDLQKNSQQSKSGEAQEVKKLLDAKIKEYERLKSEFEAAQVQLTDLHKKALESAEKLDSESADKEKKILKLEGANRILKTQMENQKVEFEKMSMLATNSRLSSDAVQQTILNLTIERDSLNEKVEMLEKEIHSSTQNVRSMESEMETLKNEIKAKCEEANQIKRDFEELRKSNEQAESLRVSWEEEKCRFSQEIASINSKYQEVFDQNEKEKAQMLTEVEKSKEEIERLRVENVNMKTTQEKINSELQQNKDVVKEVQSELENRNEELKKLKEDFFGAERQIEEFRKETANFKTEKSNLVQEMEELKSSRDKTIETSTNNLLTEKLQIESELVKLKEEQARNKIVIDEKIEIEQRLTKLIEEKVAEADKVKEDVKNSIERCSKLEDELEIAKRVEREVKENLDKIQKEREESSNQLTSQNELCENIRKDFNEKLAENERLLAEIKNRDENVEKLSETLLDAQQQVVKAEKLISDLNMEKAVLCSEVLELKSLRDKSVEASTKNLLTEKQKLETELSKMKDSIEITKKSLEEKDEAVRQLTSSVEEQNVDLKSTKEDLKSTKEKLQVAEEGFSKLNRVIEELKDVEQEKSTRFEEEKAKMSCDLAAKVELLERFEQKLTNEQAKLQVEMEKMKEMEAKMENVNSEKNILTENFTLLKNEYENASHTWNTEKSSIREEMQRQMEIMSKGKDEILAQLRDACTKSEEFEREKEKLSKEIENVKSSNNQVEEINSRWRAEKEILQENETILRKSFEQEKIALEAKVENLNETLNSLKADLNESQMRLSLSVGKESESLAKLKSENELLTMNVSHLTAKLSSVVATTSMSSPVDEEAANMQINFLNSVISDLTSKNQELQLRNDIFMQGGVDTIGSNLRRIPKPRLFCDICEVFDLHETEDCPKQCNDDEQATHSHFNGARSQSREYCDNCEVFGHSTDNCDQETF